MGEQVLPFLRIEVGNIHVLQDELLNIQVQVCRFGIGGRRRAIGAHLASFDEIELTVGFFDEV